MKKAIIALLALAGIAQADESSAYLTKDDSFSVESNGKISLKEIATSFNTGTFAVSFDMTSVLYHTGSNFDFHLGVGDGTTGKDLAFSYGENYGMGVVSFGSSLGSGNTMIFETPELLIFQVNDFFGTSPSVTLYAYNEGSELSKLLTGSIRTPLPDEITIADLTITSIGGGVIPPAEEVSLSIWQGEVTANDIQNPTPAPAVPEPTTVTLSLLALAGLAARRRRK